MTITGYKFQTEQEAIDARKACADYYGLPKSPNDVTQYWVDFSVTQYDEPQFWYIVYDDSILDILGEPVSFEVRDSEIPTIEIN
jgi:hypothetical protein